MSDDYLEQFDYMSKEFDRTLTGYREDLATGRAQPTPAGRVHEIAMIWQRFSQIETGGIICGWFLAVAIERLMALEAAGIPT
jgi:hypothetical protein